MDREFGPNREITFLGIKWWLWLIAVIVVIGLTFWGLGWLTVPFNIFSPQNVQEQYGKVIGTYNSLEAAAQQVCQTQKALDEATSDNERTQRRSQLLAYQQNYTRIQADYDQTVQNVFKARLVMPNMPSGVPYPSQSPSLQQMQQQVCR